MRDILQGSLKIPTWPPPQSRLGFGDVKLEIVGFVRVLAWVLVPIGTFPPAKRKLFNNPLDWPGIFIVRPKVPTF
jgi:hypothetical protein